MTTLQNILVATDFSEASEDAVTYARQLAQRFGSTLHVLHVVRNIVPAAIGVEGYATDFVALQHDIEKTARYELEAVITELDRRTLPVKLVLRTSNAPAHAIVAYAQDAQIDLVVVGTHGRGGMAHLLLGSVAERVVRTAGCPVLTVGSLTHKSTSPEQRHVAAVA